MAKYKSRRERRSRLAQQENRRLFRQTILIFVIIIALLAGLVVFGIPALIKLAIFLGDIRGSSTPIEQQDTIPPATPQLSTPPPATSSANISLDGYSEAGATVKLYHNGNKIEETVVDTDGNFQFPSIKLKKGLNRFYALAYDSSGNESVRSSTKTVVLDSEAPTIIITNPKPGQEFFGLNEQTINLEGETDPDVDLKVNDRLIVVGSDGAFSARYVLEEGDNTLVFTITDAAGNTTSETITVKYSR